ncbi:hypothetical protein [Pelosinus propionicus]|uniref:Uncharacterized protein n=1 Tax=Pelosinus propionicus DSM 13327 TaxID=1123291 RepID=A0A1I4QN86_9FIRM|nr:hypothetical protein [Pelosinus propionicus]SFM41511.1 hypothetical protein SAMN04490355_11146 [Pelosinus propionicus DSM 13327]
MVELMRIDKSGVFAPPVGIVESVIINGNSVDFTLVDNGNIDVTEYDGISKVFAVVKGDD